MSNSWDPTAFQQQGGGGQTQQQSGGVKLFDPTQFQNPHHQPNAALAQGGATQQQPQQPQQQYPPNSNASSFFNPEPQPGQENAWDHWGSWNWNTEGQNALVTGQGEGQGNPSGAAVESTTGQQQGQFEGQQQGQQFVGQEQPAGQFYNPEQYQNGNVAQDPNQVADSYPGWRWDPDQQQWVPDGTRDVGQHQGDQGQHFYQGQQPQQAYFDPSAWNSTDSAQAGYQWGNSIDPQTQQGVGQEAGHPQPHAGGQEPPQTVSGDHGVPVSGPELNQSVGGSGMSAPPPTLDITSHQVASVPQSQGHTRDNSIDSTASGTVAGFFGRGDDAEPTQPQPFAAVAAAPEATPPIQHLKVAELQRTDSAISNESLQTLNLSADEDSREALDEMTGQMGSLQLGGNQANKNQQTNAPPSQLYAHPGDFSGFGNYPGRHPEGKANQGGAASSGSRESDEQSPMMNDWEIVPPQAHSSTSHSRNNSLDDAINFSAKPQELAGRGDQAENSRPKMQPPDLNPAGSQSSTTQDSESFTAISSTSSSGDVLSSIPFSQTSSYYPSAASTPFTSPDAVSLISHPSSIPSWQSSPPKGVTAASTPSPVVAPPPAQMTKERSVEREGSVGSISSAKSSPEKSKHWSQQAKDIDRSLNDTTLSCKTVDGGKPLLGQGGSGSGSGRPPPPPSPRGSQEKESVGFGSPTRRHHSAFQPVHSHRAKHNMSPATTLWDNLDSTPTGNILLAPAAPLIIPSLGGNPGANTSVTTATSTTTTATSAQHPMQKSSSNSSMERLSGRDAGRKGREREGREREGGRYVSSRRSGEKSGLNKTEDFSKSRDEDNRSLGSLDELDATPDFGDDSRADRSRGYGRDPRDPRYDPYYDRPSSRSDSYREDYRKPRDSTYRGYGYRDPYYDEKYDRPRSRQEDERSSRPSSRSAREVDRPRSRAEYDRDREGYKEAYRGGGYGYEGYGPEYYYDDRERFYRYYRDSRYRRGYAEEMGQYGGPAGPQQQQYDSRYAGYYGHPFHLPPLSQHPNEDLDRSSVGSHSRGQTPALDEVDPSQADYYGRTSRPPSRTDADRERADPYRQAGYGSGYGPGYGGGYEGYGRDYYDAYYQQQYQYYGYPQYGEQPQQEQGATTGYQSGRMTPPKYLLPHVRVCFGPTGQLVTVLPTRPAEGQPAKVEIHDTQLMLQDSDEMEDLKVFPGPLVRNETHKNDVLMYCQKMAKECSEDVDMLDRESAELIWRLLELLLKQNGTIIGTDIADLLLAGHEPSTQEYAVSGPRIVQSTGQSSDPLNTPDKEDSRSSSPAVRISTDRTVISAAQQLEESTDRFRNLLLYGRKKEALDWAMKRNLWGHALFLASKMDNRTHASVMTRFANTAMRMNDPLQTLYQLMSGRQPASVTNVVDERWGDWRPHLAMILANHSARPELDKKSIIALGDTLATKHCLHASHFCYLMAQADFGSFSKKSSKLVLIGANHNLPLDEFANSKAVQCTEVYEYAQSLGNSKFSLPKFQVYKFLYACRLADNGLAQEAFHYCEVITRQVLQNPARYHPAFISILYSLSTKLKHGDPQKQHSGHDSADPEWLTQLCVICQGYEEGSIQFKSGSATPATGYGGVTPSSESGEIAGYGVENSTLGGMYPQDSTAYATNNSYNYQQTAQTQYGETAAAAGQGEGTVQQVAGTEQYGQYADNQNSQQATAEHQQYNWQQQQQQGYQQTPEQQAQQQQHYDPSQYQQQQQQQWQNYDYSQAGGYGTEQQPVAAQPTAGYHGDNTQAATEPSFQQHHQQQQHHHQQQQQQQPQVPGHTPYSGYTQPQQRNSLTSQSTDPMEGDDDDDDDEEDDDDDEVDAGDVAHTSGPQFDYFSAAAQTKVIPPGHRYRTTSTSSQGSTGGRRKRTTSGSSTGSVRAANKSSASSGKPADKKDNSQKGGAGWFGGLFGKFRKNEMKLPDDKNPSIVWDEKNKVWLNKDQGEVKETVKAPPPKDNDLMGKMPPPAAPGPSSAAPTMNGPPTMNRFSRPKGRGARGQYVDVLNPSSGGSGGSSTVPPSLFNVMPGAENFNASATGSAPQLFNPSAVPGGSSSHTDATSHQTANSLAPPSHDLSRSSSLSSLSREIQQLTMKAQELGDSSGSKSAEPVVSQQPPGMPMMFNPTQMSQPGGGQATSAAGSGMKYGHRRVYPKKL
ncbi:protein transport protein Sec16A-like isoform X2 [Littorina saxatilis]|uniref:protein transport protein Sec16A-like isoform X2 n=1 Tax=Littorina saxatilis TaxID=31220 RepID=UPI0038B5AC40